jgi:2-iminobutanoate/2-iminopropanoate deaminase
MLTRSVTTPEAPAPAGPYSQAIVSGPLVFLAGQRPVDPRTGKVPAGFAAQAEQALSNIRTVLQSAGADLSSVVKLTAYLADLSDFDGLNEVMRTWFADPYPARTTVGVQLRGVLVELDVTAVLPDGEDHTLAHESMAAPAPGAENRSAEAEESHVR